MYIIYTKENCSYCDMAKNLLIAKGLPFQDIKLGEGISREELLTKIPNARTVPQILKDDQLIGGYNELKQSLT